MEDNRKTDSVFPCRIGGKRSATLLVFGSLFAPLSGFAKGEWVEVPVEVTPPLTVSLIGTLFSFAVCSLLTGLVAWIGFAICKPRNGKEASDDEA